jgi:hypothetical protein
MTVTPHRKLPLPPAAPRPIVLTPFQVIKLLLTQLLQLVQHHPQLTLYVTSFQAGLEDHKHLFTCLSSHLSKFVKRFDTVVKQAIRTEPVTIASLAKVELFTDLFDLLTVYEVPDHILAAFQTMISLDTPTSSYHAIVAGMWRSWEEEVLVDSEGSDQTKWSCIARCLEIVLLLKGCTQDKVRVMLDLADQRCPTR